MSVNKVTVVGGSGNLGPAIVSGLQAGGFDVTALTRKESTATFPSGVTVKRVDINSLDETTEALQGQDAVVSVVGMAGFISQRTLVDAAVAAKVKRFIPSEYGVNTRNIIGTKLGATLTVKTQLVDYLIELSGKNTSFTWTAIASGPFFDWAYISGLLGFEIKNKTVKLFDSGNERFSTSTLGFIGHSVAAVLKNPEPTANKFIEIASFTTSQRELLKIVEEETGSTFTVNNVKTSDLEKEADEKLAKGDFSAFLPLIQQWIFGEGNGNAIKENDAVKLLGLQELDLRAETKKALAVWQ